MSGVGAATVRDLNAQEWSQAVIDELQHIQVATPPDEIYSANAAVRKHGRQSPHAYLAPEARVK